MGIVLNQSLKNTIITYIGFAIGGISTIFLFPSILGKTYYGFFAMAGFYAFVTIVFLLFKNKLEDIFNNYLINQIFKEKKDASN